MRIQLLISILLISFLCIQAQEDTFKKNEVELGVVRYARVPPDVDFGGMKIWQIVPISKLTYLRSINENHKIRIGINRPVRVIYTDRWNWEKLDTRYFSYKIGYQYELIFNKFRPFFNLQYIYNWTETDIYYESDVVGLTQGRYLYSLTPGVGIKYLIKGGFHLGIEFDLYGYAMTKYYRNDFMRPFKWKQDLYTGRFDSHLFISYSF